MPGARGEGPSLTDVLLGFATLGLIIALGVLLGHLRVLDLGAQQLLSRLSFLVASPALMVTVLQRADVAQVFSRDLVATAVSVAVTAACYLAVARLAWRKATGELVIGALAAVYVNAGNLGVPIAAYALGNAALVAPVLLMQLLVIQPIALGVLDGARNTGRASVPAMVLRGLRTPLTLASLLGLVLSVTGWRLPSAVQNPLELVAGMAVPAMLVAYGVSLRLGPRPGSGASTPEVALISALKLVLQPVVAWSVGRFLLHLDGPALLGVTVIAALPTAQNIFVHATNFNRSTVVVRDAVFVTTLLPVPLIVGIVAVLTVH